MKRFLLAVAAMATMVLNASAQDWNMIVTHTDGTVETIPTTEVSKVSFKLNVADVNADQVIVKELYVGGCPKDEGTSAFQQDKGFVLYNNCGQKAVINNLCVAFANPYNGHGSNDWYDENGVLYYEDKDFLPANDGVWYLTSPLIIEPYSQVVVSCMGSVDNTQTYSQSVNYANPDYYCMYDPESGYTLASYYPTPSELIPTSHYFKAVRVGQSTAWALSMSSPAFYIFRAIDTDFAAYGTDADNIIYAPNSKQSNSDRCISIPREWIIDGVEVYAQASVSNSQKRLTADVDAGYVPFVNKLGYTVYRNVDKEMTEALPENEGKLVYGYSMGVDDSTDPSGIDAEASIKNGAHIIYMDTNNSSNDFHMRKKFSIRGE